MSNLNLLISKLDECKKLALKEGLDPDQLSGIYGEAIAKKIILKNIDKGYKPAPP